MEEPSGSAEAMYFHDLANHGLLSQQEEVLLAQRIEAGRAAAVELDGEGDLSPEDQGRLQALVDDGEAARRRLIESNLRLVVSVARQYLNRGLSFLDLIQEGNIGLQIGTDKYDWRRGFRVSTYVYWWIRQSVARSLATQSRTIRLPIQVLELLRRVLRAECELQAGTGVAPSVEALAEHLGVEPERIVEARCAARTLLSIEAPLDSETDTTRGDLLCDELATHAGQRELEEHELSELLADALDLLEPRERKILQLRFGLDGGDERTLRQVAGVMRVTPERIRQIEQNALAKLRAMPALRSNLVDYLAS